MFLTFEKVNANASSWSWSCVHVYILLSSCHLCICLYDLHLIIPKKQISWVLEMQSNPNYFKTLCRKP